MPLLLLTALIALALLLLARRGRRIDDHPLCRKCRFDLTGLPPTSDRCPECGRNIRAPHATRIGHRQRIGWLLVTAWMLFLPATLSFLLLATLRITNVPLAHYEPLFLLRWNLQSSNPARSGEALTEITRRLTAGSLSEPDLAPIIDDLLARQADRTHPWSSAWGNLIFAAADHALLSPARWQSFLAHGVTLDAHVSPRVHQGASPTLWISPRPDRLFNPPPGAPLLEITINLDSHLNGVSRHVGPSVAGGWGGASFGIHPFPENAPALSLGTHTATLDCNLSTTYPPIASPPGTSTSSSTLSFEVVPASTPFITLNHDPAAHAALLKSLSLLSTTLPVPTPGGTNAFEFRQEFPPLHGTFTVELVQGDSHWPFEFQTMTLNPTMHGGFDSRRLDSTRVPLHLPHPGPAEIVLTPTDLNPDEQPLDPFDRTKFITEVFADPLRLPITLTASP